MSNERKVLVYGASGYTGKIIAECLAQRNIPFYMSGRNEQRLADAKLIAQHAEVIYEAAAEGVLEHPLAAEDLLLVVSNSGTNG